ncbi:MAG TPA: hypothetical protein VJ892_00430 [Candidatus Absconditabacterales bacterium]|nr:hypothetical protein [Candidatus Absconditabacterales bacterium]
MKKLLSFLLGTTILLGLFGFSYACEEVDIYEQEKVCYDNNDDELNCSDDDVDYYEWEDGDFIGNVCIDIDKSGNEYTLEATVSDYDGSGTPSLSCDILLPDNKQENGGSCNGTFSFYDDFDDCIDSNSSSEESICYIDGEEREFMEGLNGDIGNIGLYIWLDGESGKTYQYYDFDDGERSDGSSSNNDLDEFDFYYVGNDSPDTDERVTVRIKALDDDGDRIYDYDDEVVLHFEIDDDDADEYDLEIRSDDFDEDEYDLDYNGEIEVDFNNGYLEFEVSFDYEDDYTITVEDEGENIDADQSFDVGDSSYSSNNDLDEFDFYYVGDDSPDTDERVTVRIKALDDDGDRIYDYDDEVVLHFERDGYDADEYDLEIRSDDFDEDEYDLDYNGEIEVDFDNGYLEFEVSFDYEYDYTITVEDEGENIDADQSFDVGDSSYSSNDDLDEFDFYYVGDDSPDTDERVTVRIKALDDDGDRIYDYDDEVTLTFERDGDDADRYDIKIRSNDFSDDQYDLYNGELDVDFDNGYLEFEVWFEYEDDYTITVEDGYVDADQDFDVGDNSYSNNDLDEFDFYYVGNDSPDTDERTTVRIKALDDDGDRIYDYDDEVVLHFERDNDDADEYDLEIRSDDFDEDEYDLDYNGEIEVDFNNGYLEFEVSFDYEDDYTITVEDEGENIDADQSFDVGDNGSNDSDVDGFTNDEFETIERIYDVRPRLIRQLEIENNDLRDDNEWEDISDELYDNMEDVINDRRNKEFDDYDEFFDAFEDWYSYTLDVIH